MGRRVRSRAARSMSSRARRVKWWTRARLFALACLVWLVAGLSTRARDELKGGFHVLHRFARFFGVVLGALAFLA